MSAGASVLSREGDGSRPGADLYVVLGISTSSPSLPSSATAVERETNTRLNLEHAGGGAGTADNVFVFS